MNQHQVACFHEARTNKRKNHITPLVSGYSISKLHSTAMFLSKWPVLFLNVVMLMCRIATSVNKHSTVSFFKLMYGKALLRKDEPYADPFCPVLYH